MRRIVVSCRADLRLAEAVAWLGIGGSARPRVIVGATSTGAAEVARRAAWAHGGSFGWHRTTLAKLAIDLAATNLSERGLAPATPVTLLAIAARTIAVLNRAGALGRFAAIADRPGLAEAVARTVREIRLAGIDANRTEQLPADIARLVATFDAELHAARIADEATLMALAIEAVGARSASPFLGIPLLLIDAPVRWPLESRLIAALESQSGDFLATVPAGDERTIDALALLGATPECLEVTAHGALTRLQTHLFAEPPKRSIPTSEVSVFSAPGEDRECVEIARRILAAAREGVPFDRMGILLRAPTPYRLHLDEALARAGIPGWWAQGTKLPDPGGRAFLALLACRAENYSARRFAEYLSLGEVPSDNVAGTTAIDDEPPDMAALDPSVRAPRRWEGLLTDAAVMGGIDRWRRRLAGLETGLNRTIEALVADPPRREREEQRLAQLRALRDFALPVLTHLETLPTSATWREWLPPLRALARATLRDPDRVLDVLRELYAMGPVGPVDLVEVRRVLAPHLREIAAPPPAHRSRRVLIGPIDAARGLDFDLVFVPGLAERGFPQRVAEDPLLLDAHRTGFALETNPDRVAAERLALRIAVGAATRAVVCSWPRLELDAVRPRVPSFYALEVIRATEGHLPSFRELAERADGSGAARIGWPAPAHADDAIDDAEFDLSVLNGLLREPAEATRGRARWLVDASPHLGRSLRARWSRWDDRLHRWDGLHAPLSEAVRAVAAAYLPSTRAWPATTLELFPRCPYRLYLRGIQRLAPREDPIPIESIDAMSRGSIVHETLYLVLVELRRAGLLPAHIDQLEASRTVVDTILDDVAARWHDDLAPAIERIWTDEIAAIRADLREWLVRMADEPQWVPDRFELAFGLPGHARCDDESRADPLTLTNGLVLRGSIDLVERRAADGAVRVTDFKTGKVRAAAGDVVRGGQTLQPLLYAMACESLFPGANVLSGGLWYVTASGGFDRVDIALDEAARRRVDVVVDSIGSSIREATLIPAPADGECRYCEYRSVCGRSEEQRAKRKPAASVENVMRVRELP